MRIRIIKEGLFGDGPIPVGAEFNVRGAPPAGWAGKYVVLTPEPAPEAEPVVNPAPAEPAPDFEDMDKDEVLAWLDANGWTGDRRTGVDRLRTIAEEIAGG
jgi:hypothetical protein